MERGKRERERESDEEIMKRWFTIASILTYT